jgi:hypothetical protein
MLKGPLGSTMTTRNDVHSDASVRRGIVGGCDDCEHRSDARRYLGSVGGGGLYQCTDCGGALLVW